MCHTFLNTLSFLYPYFGIIPYRIFPSHLVLFLFILCIKILPAVTIHTAYDEIADLLSMADPTRLLNLRASEEMQQRLEFLIEKSKESDLDKVEKDELDHYIVLERLVRLAKIRARARAERA